MYPFKILQYCKIISDLLESYKKKVLSGSKCSGTLNVKDADGKDYFKKRDLPEKFLHRNRIFKYEKGKRGTAVGFFCLITMIQLCPSTNAIVHCINILVKVRHICSMFGRVMFVATA